MYYKKFDAERCYFNVFITFKGNWIFASFDLILKILAIDSFRVRLEHNLNCCTVPFSIMCYVLHFLSGSAQTD